MNCARTVHAKNSWTTHEKSMNGSWTWNGPIREKFMNCSWIFKWVLSSWMILEHEMVLFIKLQHSRRFDAVHRQLNYCSSISKGCFIFGFASLPLEVTRPILPVMCTKVAVKQQSFDTREIKQNDKIQYKNKHSLASKCYSDRNRSEKIPVVGTSNI